MIADAGCPVEITLFDLNEKLMRQAAAALSSVAQTSGVLGDINVLSAEQFGSITFDIVMFVSGLHHVMEIEHVLQTVTELLVPNGEFWIIGEVIGRNGNQLWPEALDAANRVFSLLPERFRLTRLPATSILRFLKRTFQLIALKEFGVRRSSRFCCGISIPWKCGGETAFFGV